MNLVTGGSGFFGTHLVRQLLELGEKVRVFDIAEPDRCFKGKIDFVKGDIRNLQHVKNACKGIKIVYHTVAAVPVSKAGKLFEEVNTKGTENLLRASLENNIKKVIHISSSSVYDKPKKGEIIDENFRINPVSDYGRAKYKAELKCIDYIKKGLNVTIIRPRTILGKERMGIFSIFFEWIMNGKNVYIIGRGDNKFSFIEASDLADACILASKMNENEIFNISTDKYETLYNSIKSLIDSVNSKSKIICLNPRFFRPILKILSKMNLLPISEFHYMTMDKEYAFDIRKAKNMLRFSPKYSNKDMLIESYYWYVKNYDHIKNKIGKSHKFSPKKGLIKILNLLS